MLKMIKKLFGITTYDYVVTFTMKSGKEIKVKCDTFTFSYTGESITEYHFDDSCVADIKWICMSEIAHIALRKI